MATQIQDLRNMMSAESKRITLNSLGIHDHIITSFNMRIHNYSLEYFMYRMHCFCLSKRESHITSCHFHSTLLHPLA